MGLAAFNRMRRMQAEKEAIEKNEKKKPSPKKKEAKPKGE